MSRCAFHRISLGRVLLAGILAATAAGLAAPPAHAAGPYQYFALTPCRIADTRFADGNASCPFTGNCAPSLVGNANQTNGRYFQVEGHCGVPTGAVAVTINVTEVGPHMTVANGFLTIWPAGSAKPTVSTLNFTNSDTALANGALVPLTQQTGGDLAVFFGAAGTVDFIVDVTGYFQ
jgi:hypothetical protein